LAEASAKIRKIIGAPAVEQSAARLRDIMLGSPGLCRPTDPVENRMDDQQRRAAQPGDEDVLLGDSVDVHEHVLRAQDLQHPLHHNHTARDDLRAAIEFVVDKPERGEQARARDQRLQSFQREAELLKKVDSDIYALKSGPARRLVIKLRTGRRPSVALWAALVRAMYLPDKTVIDGLIVGFPTVGEYPATGIFREKERVAEHTVENLDHVTHNARLAGVLARLAQSDSPAAAKASRQSEQMTKEEVVNKRMRGPFYTAAQVEEDLGAAPESWRALHRFAIRQGEKSDGAPKWRCCDNGRSSGTNACLSGPETITRESATFPTLVARVLAEMWPAELRLSPMRHGTEDVDGA
jgi:hypothetical protein